jgi:hypothetical protein
MVPGIFAGRRCPIEPGRVVAAVGERRMAIAFARQYLKETQPNSISSVAA